MGHHTNDPLWFPSTQRWATLRQIHIAGRTVVTRDLLCSRLQQLLPRKKPMASIAVTEPLQNFSGFCHTGVCIHLWQMPESLLVPSPAPTLARPRTRTDTQPWPMTLHKPKSPAQSPTALPHRHEHAPGQPLQLRACMVPAQRLSWASTAMPLWGDSAAAGALTQSQRSHS